VNQPLTIAELEARLHVYHDQIPAELKLIPHWVNWKYQDDGLKKPRKPLFNPRTGAQAKKNDPNTWGTYAEAVARDPKHIGFVLTKDCGFYGVDQDDCRNYETFAIVPEATKVIMELGSYTEISPSGTGFHTIVKGSLPSGIKTRVNEIEVYDEQYLTFTGNVHAGFPKIEPRDPRPFLARHGFLSDDKPSDCQGTEIDLAGGRVLKTLPKFIKEALSEVEQVTTGDGRSDQDAACVLSMLKYGLTPKDVAATFAASPRGEYATRRGHKLSDYVPRTVKWALKKLELRIACHRLSESPTEVIEYLLDDYTIPKGMLTYMFGAKGIGKTRFNNWLTSVVTRQGLTVVRFNTEDSERAILKPSLYAAGSDLSKVLIPDGIDGQTADFSQPDHRQALKRLIAEEHVALVIIEPVRRFKGKAKANSEDDMGPIFDGLSSIAEQTGCAIVAVGHVNRRNDCDVQDKAMGDSSHIRVARANYFLQRDPVAKELIHVMDAGSNIMIGKNRTFRIVEQPSFELDGVTVKNVAIAVMLDGEDDRSADEMLDESRTIKRSTSDNIAKFLVENLKGRGWVSTSRIKHECLEENPDWKFHLVKVVFSRRKLGKVDGAGSSTKWKIDSQLSLVNGHATGAEPGHPAIEDAIEEPAKKPQTKDIM
jgi:hypothetical protein